MPQVTKDSSDAVKLISQDLDGESTQRWAFLSSTKGRFSGLGWSETIAENEGEVCGQGCRHAHCRSTVPVNERFDEEQTTATSKAGRREREREGRRRGG